MNMQGVFLNCCPIEACINWHGRGRRSGSNSGTLQTHFSLISLKIHTDPTQLAQTTPQNFDPKLLNQCIRSCQFYCFLLISLRSGFPYFPFFSGVHFLKIKPFLDSPSCISLSPCRQIIEVPCVDATINVFFLMKNLKLSWRDEGEDNEYEG